MENKRSKENKVTKKTMKNLKREEKNKLIQKGTTSNAEILFTNAPTIHSCGQLDPIITIQNSYRILK